MTIPTGSRESAKKSKIRSYRDLLVWQRGKLLAKEIYYECCTMPRAEQFVTVPQMRRSSESVPSNVAEGFGLGTRPGFLRHLRIARGSLCELETPREISLELGLMKARPRTHELLDETHRLLQGLIRSLERSTSAGPESRRG